MVRSDYVGSSLLALISEIVQRDRHPQVTQEDAVTQLKKLLTVFYDQAAENHIDLSRFKLMDFGTRRRFSYDVQSAIVSLLKEEFPYLVGTSNYKLAHKLGLALSAPKPMNGSKRTNKLALS